ncbi:MAG: hypothetical protein GTO18_09915 [Anaerolineales bacterium]|nr:hypothetical protein [Anaerolineales bacterium]
MTVEIVVPQVGEAVAEVTLIEWLKEEGDRVEKGDPLFLVDTDKAVVEVEAFTAGMLFQILVAAGSPVMPQQVVGILAAEGEDVERLPEVEIALDVEPEARASEQIQISPVAERLAKELGVDLEMVIGSGPGGRISADDVRQYASAHEEDLVAGVEFQKATRVAASPKARKLARELGVDLEGIIGTGEGGLITVTDVESAVQKDRPIPFSKQRATIASRMQKSKGEVPHFYLMIDVDMSEAEKLRAHCIKQLGWDRPPTYTDIMVRACALSLVDMPSVNVIYNQVGKIQRDSVDVGIAVGVKEGLIVPVLPDADRKDLRMTSQELRAMGERARQGRLRESDLSAKSMVVTNLGMFGVDAFIAIIDIPDPMILSVGRVTDRVVPMGDQPVIRPYCTLTLSIDHRILDGILGAEFLGKVKDYLEDSFKLLE